MMEWMILAAAVVAILYVLSKRKEPPELEPEPSEFMLSDLTILPETAYPGDTIGVIVTVTNTGEQVGTCKVTLEVATKTQIKSIRVRPGLSNYLAFQVKAEEVGVYQVRANSLYGSFTVLEPEVPAGLWVHPSLTFWLAPSDSPGTVWLGGVVVPYGKYGYGGLGYILVMSRMYADDRKVYESRWRLKSGFLHSGPLPGFSPRELGVCTVKFQLEGPDGEIHEASGSFIVVPRED